MQLGYINLARTDFSYRYNNNNLVIKALFKNRLKRGKDSKDG